MPAALSTKTFFSDLRRLRRHFQVSYLSLSSWLKPSTVIVFIFQDMVLIPRLGLLRNEDKMTQDEVRPFHKTFPCRSNQGDMRRQKRSPVGAGSRLRASSADSKNGVSRYCVKVAEVTGQRVDDEGDAY